MRSRPQTEDEEEEEDEGGEEEDYDWLDNKSNPAFHSNSVLPSYDKKNKKKVEMVNFYFAIWDIYSGDLKSSPLYISQIGYVLIGCMTDGLNNKLLFPYSDHGLKNELLVRYSGQGLNNELLASI